MIEDEEEWEIVASTRPKGRKHLSIEDVEKLRQPEELEDTAETNPELAQIANFYQQLIKIGGKGAPDASGNVVIREAAYIVWAALMRDGSSPPSDPDVKAEEKPQINAFNQRRR